jgi:1-acyl-sn-glycerol-3-phosphate acyltransferase
MRAHTCPGGWLPVSACGPDCLPPLTPRGRTRAGLRLGALAAVLLATAATTPLLPAALRGRWLRRCCRLVLRAAGVRLAVRGDVAYGAGALVVANHLSWLDVVALHAVAPVRMLAKREVRDWPVIGTIAARTGSLFVDRAGLRALPATVSGIADALRAGATVGVFPEGTTWCGAAGGPFRRAAFQAAIDAGAPVRPVALALRHADGTPAPSATFVGDQDLLDSLRRVVREPGLVCELTVLPLLSPTGDRRELAARAAAAVAAATGVAHAERVRPRVPAQVPASPVAA